MTDTTAVPPVGYSAPVANNGAAPVANGAGEGGTAAAEERELLRLSIAAAAKRAVVAGGTFVLDIPAAPVPVWGEGNRVLAAQGEPTMIDGPAGVGKTTIAHQLILARMGIRDQVLGLPVLRDDRPVLYIAADRPPQAQRSLHRMVTEDQRALLDERLVVWKGALPHDIGKRPEILPALVEYLGAGTLVIDSLKDVAVKLLDDEVGGQVNHALQQTALLGTEVFVLHHQRKGQQGVKKPKSLDEVYGSTWLTAGMGSVIVIWGAAGDLVVEVSHLKQPMEEVGPLTVLHNHASGVSTVQSGLDVYELVQAAAHGLTANDAACAVFGVRDPKPNEIEKARRKLDDLVTRGVAHKVAGQRGGPGGTRPVLYFPVTRAEP